MLFDFLCPETALLDGLSQFKPEYDFTVCSDVLLDKYIAASALQKALRRKNLKQAMFAAAVLKRIDEGYLFRRLKCCALEDVGPADLDTVSQVLWVSGKRDWMSRHGGSDFVLAYLLHRLCQSKALRTTDNLIYTACKSPLYAGQREVFSGMTLGELADAFMEEDRDAAELTLLAYFMCGTRYPCDDLDLKKGSPDHLLDTCYSFGVPAFLTDMLKLSRSYEFFVSLVPAWIQLERADTIRIVNEALASSVMIGSWPSEALDRHTAAGKRSYRLFLKSCPPVSGFIAKHLPKADAVDLIAWAVFVLEGQCLNNKIEYDEANRLQELTEDAWMSSKDMTAEVQTELLALVKDNMETLHDSRQQIMSNINNLHLSAR
ncbi:MAG: hypothetical protein KDI13_11050 [Alphaproteobacteria bacterium]|nr:hypothetical protein [Alphaproteobacteria bacterium]